MSNLAPIFDIDQHALNWVQEGSFLGADGRPVRAYDDVVLLREILPENDPAAVHVVSANTTGTILFFSTRPDGVAQLELNWLPGQGCIIGYEDQRYLQLHMTNEEKYPR